MSSAPLRSALLACSASAACLAVSATASAETAAPPPPRATATTATATSNSDFDVPHLGIEASLGLWTPLGSAGATLIGTPTRELSFEAGVGMALSGPQLSGMVRVHPMRGKVQLSVAGGFSTGRFREPGFYGPTYTWNRATWANGEVSLDVRLSDQMMLRLFGGMGLIVTDEKECVSSDSGQYGPRCDDPKKDLPFGGIALRSAFALGD
jgi:hypothetical protein